MYDLRWFFAIAFLMLFVPKNLVGQSNTFYRSDQLWVDFNPSWNVGQGKKIITDVDYRLIWPRSWNRFVVRAGYQYRVYNFLFKKIKTDEDFSVGLGFFYTARLEGSNSYEVRPYQGYKVSFLLNQNWKMKHYLRFEERIGVAPEQKESSFDVRVRYQIGTDYYIRNKQSGAGFYIPLSVEFFFNLFSESGVNDVLRLTPGLGYQINSDFKIQATLGYHFTQFKTAGLNAVVYRVSMYKTIF